MLSDPRGRAMGAYCELLRLNYIEISRVYRITVLCGLFVASTYKKNTTKKHYILRIGVSRFPSQPVDPFTNMD